MLWRRRFGIIFFGLCLFRLAGLSGGEPTTELASLVVGFWLLVLTGFVELVLSPSFSLSALEESSSCSKRRMTWMSVKFLWSEKLNFILWRRLWISSIPVSKLAVSAVFDRRISVLLGCRYRITSRRISLFSTRVSCSVRDFDLWSFPPNKCSSCLSECLLGCSLLVLLIGRSLTSCS